MASIYSNAPIAPATPRLDVNGGRKLVDSTRLRAPRNDSRRKCIDAKFKSSPASAYSIPQEIYERKRQQAQRINQILHDADMQENFQRIMKREGKFAYLDLQPNIKPSDDEWKHQFQHFSDALCSSSVEDVLNNNFSDWQKLFLMPPLVAGEILKLQEKNTIKYKEAMGTNGVFSIAHDNLITKMTMLHFGLPIQPITVENILRAGTDENDPEDAPEEKPRLQRIVYSEAPLEFLDGYDERSYGYPTIRRKSNMHLRGGGAVDIDLQSADLDDNEGDNEADNSIIHMRGGATKDRVSAVRKLWLYGAGGRLEVKPPVDAEKFVDTALRFLGIYRHQTSNWEFIIDQYRSLDKDRQHEKTPRTYMNSYTITNSNYQKQWADFLENRFMKHSEECLMVVCSLRNSLVSAPATYSPLFKDPRLPTKPISQEKLPEGLTCSQLGSPPDTPQLPQLSEAQDHLYTPGSGSRTRLVSCMRINSDFTSVEVENNYTSFSETVRRALSLQPHQQFHVVFYSNQLDMDVPRYGYRYSHSCKSGPLQFARYISPKLFGPKDEWVIVAASDASTAVRSFWPPGFISPTDAPKLPTVIPQTPNAVNIWRGSKKFLITNDPTSFGSEVERALNIGSESTWTVSVDFYSNQMDKTRTPRAGKLYDHTVNIAKPFEQTFGTLIGPKIFDSRHDWEIVIRLPGEPRIDILKPDPNTIWSGMVRGYAGRLVATNEYESFRNAALDLLFLSDSTDWWFFVDIFEENGTYIESSHVVTKATFHGIFQKDILPALAGGQWKVFVRSTAQTPQHLEPDHAKQSVVRIEMADHGTAYWRLPSDMIAYRYAANQLQDDFSRAMRVFFPNRLPRPPTIVAVRNIRGGRTDQEFNLGFGGVELSDDLFRCLESSRRQYSGEVFRLVVMLKERKSNPITVRLAGSSETCTIHEQSPQLQMDTIYDDIVEISRLVILSSNSQGLNQLPANFRLWGTAEDRENGGASVLIRYNSAQKAAAVEDMHRFLGRDMANLGTNCLWVRPEYESFMVTHIHNPTGPEILWNSSHGQRSLGEFRKVIQSLFNNPLVSGDIELIEPTRSHRFVINSITTDRQWRQHIVDMILCRNLQVREDVNIPYVLNTTGLWGVPETPPSVRPTSLAVVLSPIPSLSESSTATGLNPKPTRVPSGYLLENRAAAIVRFNKERFLKPKVSQPKPVAYEPWMAESIRQNAKKHKSWHSDLSVIEPGQKPEVNIYGPSAELILSQGSNLPELYCQPYTPSDIKALMEENRRLRNELLDRRHKCDWCDVTFTSYEVEEKRDHYKMHAQQIKEGGQFCPVCGTEDWMFMDTRQRREHLFEDQKSRESEIIKKFWNLLRCPICDKDLSREQPELVLRHVASHNPDVLKFCHRCGCNEQLFTKFEESHHTRICIKSLEAHDKRIFCDRCGSDRTKETAKQTKKHDRQCPKTNGYFCHLCGIDMSNLSPDDRHGHRQNCKSPAGPPRGFCTRCGKDRMSMDKLAELAHQIECLNSDPRPRIEAKKVKECDERYNQITTMRAKLRLERSSFLQGKKAWEDHIVEEVGPCVYNHTHSFAGLDRRAIADHYKNEHPNAQVTHGSDVDCHFVLPNGSKCPYRVVIPMGGGSLDAYNNHLKDIHFNDLSAPNIIQCPLLLPYGQRCRENINNNLSQNGLIRYAEHVQDVHIRTRAAPADIRCPIVTNNRQCMQQIQDPLSGPGIANYAHHVQSFHSNTPSQPVPAEAPCRLPLSDGVPCTYRIKNPLSDLEIIQFARHVQNSHSKSGSTIDTHVTKWQICPWPRYETGAKCDFAIASPLEGDRIIGIIDHYIASHISSKELVPPAATIFKCPILHSVTRAKCNQVITVPIATQRATLDAFIRHYQHNNEHDDSDQHFLHTIFNSQERVMRDRLTDLEAQRITVPAAKASGTPTHMATRGLSRPRPVIASIANETVIKALDSCGGANSSVNFDTTSFAPSEEHEGTPSRGRSRKRKAIHDARGLNSKRLYDEPVLEYNSRFKRREIEPNVVEYVEGNKDGGFLPYVARTPAPTLLTGPAATLASSTSQEETKKLNNQFKDNGKKNEPKNSPTKIIKSKKRRRGEVDGTYQEGGKMTTPLSPTPKRRSERLACRLRVLGL